MFSIQSYSTFFTHFPKAGIVLRIGYITRSKTCGVFSLRHQRILYRNKIKSPE